MGLVGEQHHETIDANAQTSGGWQAVLQCQQIVVVDRMCLLVTGGAGGGLLLESPSLVIGVVELAESIGVLRAGNHQFEPVGKTWIGGAATGQRRDLDRLVGDKGGVPDLGLDEHLRKSRR